MNASETLQKMQNEIRSFTEANGYPPYFNELSEDLQREIKQLLPADNLIKTLSLEEIQLYLKAF